MPASKPIISVSTKTGDKGVTGLANGQRLPKDALVFEILGTLDELNSWLGLVISIPSLAKDQRRDLMEIQDIFFQFGAVVASSPKVVLEQKILVDLEKKSEELQQAMDSTWTTQFLYPGGVPLAAHLDIARTVCRRLERLLVRFNNNQADKPLPAIILQYINRFSDYLFVLRCSANYQAGYQEEKFSYAKKLLGSSNS